MGVILNNNQIFVIKPLKEFFTYPNFEKITCYCGEGFKRDKIQITKTVNLYQCKCGKIYEIHPTEYEKPFQPKPEVAAKSTFVKMIKKEARIYNAKNKSKISYFDYIYFYKNPMACPPDIFQVITKYYSLFLKFYGSEDE